jgi:ribonuclease Z
MSANLLVNMRPPGPPIKETFADEGDLFHPAIISPTTHALPNGTLERFTEVRANVEEHIKSGKVSKPQGGDIKILPLGTGSALPSKYRNGLCLDCIFRGILLV